ncbi:MAG: hypothetical protein U0840_11360 [Gemmataceae bacterium]
MSCLTWLTYWWNLRPAPAMGSLYASLEERCNQARSDEALHLDTIVRQMQTAGSVRLDDIEAVARIRSRLGTRFASLDDLYFRSIREAVLIDGYITPDRAQWLRDLLGPPRLLDAPHRQFLVELHTQARHVCPLFQEMLDEALGL